MEFIIKRATFEDLEFVKKLWFHPAVYPYINDDLSLGEEINFEVIIGIEKMYLLIAILGGEKIGFFFFHPWNSITFEVHTVILPEYRGKNAILVAQKAKEWFFENTVCRKIMTQVPFFNMPAYALAKKAGFKIEGINENSFLRNGKLYDQYIMGLKKEN